MNLVMRENNQYRLGNRLVTLFTAPFIVWQMGVLYYSGTSLSLFGRTPVPLTQESTISVIVAGYIFSIIFLCIFPRKAVWAERILLPVAAISTVCMLLPFSSAVITVLFYIEAFICTFSIGVMLSVAAHQLTAETLWWDGIIGMFIGGILIAVMQNEIYNIGFTLFTVASVLLIAVNTFFYWLIPAKIEVPYVSSKNKIRMPKILFLGLWSINSFSTLLLCFASSFAESVPHGISVLYLSAAFMAVVLHIIRRKQREKSLRIYGGFFALSVLGFVMAYLSLNIRWLRYPSLALLGFIVVLAVMWMFFGAVSFSAYPTKHIGAIGAGMGLTLTAFHSGLQEVLRDNLMLLYGIYAALSVALLIVYYFLEPYFACAWNRKEAQAAEEIILPENQQESDALQPAFKRLSEQETNLARLILSGYTESSIAAQMNITLNTQKSYRKNLYAKLDIHSKRELFELSNQIK